MSTAVDKLFDHFVGLALKRFNLILAITELDTSIHEIEEILKLRHHRDNRPLNGDVNSNIQQEISRLRRLVDYAQDSKSVIEKTQEFISKQKQVIDEDIAEVSAVNELNNENYEELVTFLRNQKAFNSDDDYNSDEESFISATESVEYQVSIININIKVMKFVVFKS